MARALSDADWEASHRAQSDALSADLRAALGLGAFEARFADGRALSLDEVLVLVGAPAL